MLQKVIVFLWKLMGNLPYLKPLEDINEADFDVKDRECSNSLQKCKDQELESLLYKDP